MTYGDLLLPYAIIWLLKSNGLYFLSLHHMMGRTRYPGLKHEHLEKVIYKAQSDGLVKYEAATHYWHATPKGWAFVQNILNHVMFETRRG